MKTDPARPDIFGVETRSDFAMAFSGSPPPIGEQLAQLSLKLMLAADSHIIPAPARAPDLPTLAGALTQLRGALAGFGARGDPAQAPLFWTDPAALGSGEITRALSNAVRPGEPAQGFLVLIAEAVAGPLIYLPRRSPIRVSAPIAGDLRLDGPYLVLVLCEAAVPGRMVLTGAHATAVAEVRRLLPVASDLERDVVRVLIHLQSALDAFGMECDVIRELPALDDRLVHFAVTTRFRGGSLRNFCFAVAANAGTSAVRDGSGRAELVVTDRAWRDGTFIAWLIRMCDRAAGDDLDPA